MGERKLERRHGACLDVRGNIRSIFSHRPSMAARVLEAGA